VSAPPAPPAGPPVTIGPNTTDPAPGSTHQYTRDNSGSLISLRTNGARYYYFVAGSGSGVGLVNDSVIKVNSYSYDPYGIQQIADPWRYASAHLDGGTGLSRFGARYYDPALGRFTQRKDLSYAYADCDPANRTDPAGHSWRCKTAEWGARAPGVAVGGALGFGVGTLAGGPAGAAIGADRRHGGGRRCRRRLRRHGVLGPRGTSRSAGAVLQQTSSSELSADPLSKLRTLQEVHDRSVGGPS
jgi:RHS repeat-associated protein